MNLKSVFFLLFGFLTAQFAVSDCKQLDAKKLDELMMSASLQAKPGDTVRFAPFTRECCVIDTPATDLCAVWSVTPAKGVQINPQTGELVIDKSVPVGSTFTVKADVEKGRKILTSKVTIYTPQQNPFVGRWKEGTQLECDTNKEFLPARSIEEIDFKADGMIYVTWTPFEVYRDYWGTYIFDLKKGDFKLTGVEGNYVPEKLDHTGTFVIQPDGSLILKSFWFGQREKEDKKACGHRLLRVSR